MSSSPPPSRRWLCASWIFGAILAGAIFLALGAIVWRMEKIYNVVDSDIASAEDLKAVVTTSLHWARIGLYTGIPAALFYVLSLVMHHLGKGSGQNSPSGKGGDEWD